MLPAAGYVIPPTFTERSIVTKTPAPADDQIWADNDPRADKQLLLIERIDGNLAVARPIALSAQGAPILLNAAIRIRIRLDRLQPTSTDYRYIGKTK